MVAVTLLSIILIATDHRLQKSHQIKQWMEASLYPLHQLIDFPSSMSVWIADETTSSESLQEMIGVEQKKIKRKPKKQKKIQQTKNK